MRRNTVLSTIILFAVILTITACQNPAGSGSIPTIDLEDPIAVLAAIPESMNLSDSIDGDATRVAARSILRAASPTVPAQVFHSDVSAVNCRAIEDMNDASMSYAINLILKSIRRINVPTPKSDGTIYSLGTLVLDDYIAEAINANPSDYAMTFHGVIIDRIDAMDSPNGTKGFSYYLPVTFNHNSMGTITIYPYFEVFTHDANNMEMRYTMYVEDTDVYYNYMNSSMTVTAGKQSIGRYENDFGDPSYWWFQYFETDPSTGKTISAFYGNDAGDSATDPYERWQIIAADNSGGVSLFNDNVAGSSLTAEYFNSNGNLLAIHEDSDAGSAIPADITSFAPDTWNYGYRYLQDNLGDVNNTTVITYEFDGSHDFRVYQSSEVHEATTDLLLLGDINSGIIEGIDALLPAAYPELVDYLDGTFDGTAIDTMMSPSSLGVDDHAGLTTTFNSFGL